MSYFGTSRRRRRRNSDEQSGQVIKRRSLVLPPLACGAAILLSRMAARAQGTIGLQIIAADNTGDALAAVNEAIAAAGGEAGRVRAVPGGSVFQTVIQLANAAQPSTAVLAADVLAFLQQAPDPTR